MGFFRGMIDSEKDIDPLHAALEVVGHVREFRSVVAEGGFVADKVATGDETGVRPLANTIRTLQVTRGREEKRSKAGSSDRTFVYRVGQNKPPTPDSSNKLHYRCPVNSLSRRTSRCGLRICPYFSLSS